MLVIDRLTVVKIALVLGIVAVVAIAAVATLFILPALQRREVPAITITVYGGEIGPTTYGFGLSEDKITSPGPDIRVKVGTKVQINFKNVGKIPHNFVIASEKRFDAEPLWDVEIGTITKPIGAGEEGSVTFIPNRSGEFYYICTIPGHIELGMYGKVIVEE